MSEYTNISESFASPIALDAGTIGVTKPLRFDGQLCMYLCCIGAHCVDASPLDFIDVNNQSYRSKRRRSYLVQSSFSDRRRNAFVGRICSLASCCKSLLTSDDDDGSFTGGRYRLESNAESSRAWLIAEGPSADSEPVMLLQMRSVHDSPLV